MATAKSSLNAALAASSKASISTKPAQAEGDKPKGLKVIPKRDGFRRAGFAFPDGGTVIPLSELSDEQYTQLTTEPMLVTVLVDLDVVPESSAD